ncbi:MAG: DUF1902 domain-containing protein [Anaerohalosphaera sp.]|nr:DUF1902 domain-containing protein [Anaerohalosphaera sp.]
MKNILLIKASWDLSVKVWVAESDDVPGLVTEAENMELLVKKLKILIPELLELNDSNKYDNIIPFSVTSEYSDIIYG